MRREVKTLLGREERGLGSRERGTDCRKSWGRSWAAGQTIDCRRDLGWKRDWRTLPCLPGLLQVWLETTGEAAEETSGVLAGTVKRWGS